MALTITEKYVLAVLETYGKASGLQREDQALCLASACVWEMMQEKSVTADKKGKLRISSPLPAALSYCSPVYKRLAKKPMKPERAALDYSFALTNRRLKHLAESTADDLIDKSVLVVEQKGSLWKVRLCYVDTAVIAKDIDAIKHMAKASAPEQTNLAILLLESGTAKKLLNKQELTVLKKAVKQVNSDFHAYVKKVKKIFWAVKAVIWAGIGVCGTLCLNLLHQLYKKRLPLQ